MIMNSYDIYPTTFFSFAGIAVATIVWAFFGCPNPFSWIGCHKRAAEYLKESNSILEDTLAQFKKNRAAELDLLRSRHAQEIKNVEDGKNSALKHQAANFECELGRLREEWDIDGKKLARLKRLKELWDAGVDSILVSETGDDVYRVESTVSHPDASFGVRDFIAILSNGHTFTARWTTGDNNTNLIQSLDLFAQNIGEFIPEAAPARTATEIRPTKRNGKARR